MSDNTLIKGLFWKFSQTLSSQGVTFIISIVLARILLPEEYGIIAIVNVFIVFSQVFVSDGFSAALIQKKDADNVDANNMFYCSLAVAVVLYVLLWIFSKKIAEFFAEPLLSPVIRVYSICLILNSYNAIQIAWLSKKLHFKKQFTSTIIAGIFSGVAGIVIAYNGGGVWAIVVQSLLNILLNILVLSRILDWHPTLDFSFTKAKTLVNYGYKILSSNLLRTTSNEIRQLLIGKYFLVSDLAIYNRGVSFSSFFYSNITNTITSVLFPLMSGVNDNPVTIKDIMRKAIKVNSLCLCFFIGLLAIVAKPLVLILLTEKWIGCVPYLQISCISTIIGIISSINLQALKAIGKSNVIFRLECFKTPVFLVLLILSINISLMAVAVSLPIYSFYSAIVNTSPSKKYFEYSYLSQVKDFIPGVILFIVCGIPSYSLQFILVNQWNILFAQIAVFTILYGTLCIIFKPSGYTILWNKFKSLLLAKSNNY